MVHLFPRSLATLKMILAAKSLDSEAAEVPTIVHSWGKSKPHLESTWLMLEDAKGWGSCPLVELDAGTEDIQQAELPTSAQLAEEMVALLRAAVTPVTWTAAEICTWLARVETIPHDHDEAALGPYTPRYALLDLSRCQPKQPQILWHVFPGMSQSTPGQQDQDLNNHQGTLHSSGAAARSSTVGS